MGNIAADFLTVIPDFAPVILALSPPVIPVLPPPVIPAPSTPVIPAKAGIHKSAVTVGFAASDMSTYPGSFAHADAIRPASSFAFRRDS